MTIEKIDLVNDIYTKDELIKAIDGFINIRDKLQTENKKLKELVKELSGYIKKIKEELDILDTTIRSNHAIQKF